jgi:predicted DNA-binding transcriptional regulator YafY
MPLLNRLSQITTLLQDGRVHRAEDLADQFGVSPRTIYRDMARLKNSGVPLQGTPGDGYRATAETTLPPLSLTGAELEVFRLGLSVVSDAGDVDQKTAAQSLLEKLDQALVDGPTPLTPLPPSPNLQQNVSLIRQAISARQRLRVSVDANSQIVRPLRLDYFGRIWRCICWNETLNDFDALVVADISYLSALPSLFVDEAGKTLKDYLTS